MVRKSADEIRRVLRALAQALGPSAVVTMISATALLAAGWVEKRVLERYS